MKVALPLFLFFVFCVGANAQNVGIGLVNPSVNLHVDSVIKIGKSQSISASTPGRVNALRFGDGSFVNISEDTRDDQMNIRAGMVLINKSSGSVGAGNVGINVDSATARLDVNGSLRFRSAGTPGMGKILTSDADGNATWQTLNAQGTSIYIVGSTDFRAQLSSTPVSIFGGNGGAYPTTPGLTSLVAPVHLPNGAKVTEVTFYVVDNVAADMNLVFGEELGTSAGYGGTGVSISSTGAAAGTRAFTAPANFTINNGVSSYYVNVNTQWSGTSTTLIKSVMIKYEY